jgi:hypothetical protein
MDLYELRDAKFDSLADSVKDWGELVRKLESLEKEAREGLKGLAEKADWTGVNASVSKEFIGKTAKEFADARKEAGSIHNILKDTHDELVSYRKQLHDALSDADKQHLWVSCSGDQIIVTAQSAGPNGPDPSTYSEDDLQAMLHRVQDIMKNANASDSSAASALSGLVGLTPVGFSSAPVIKDRDHAAAALQRERIRQRGLKLDEEYRKNTRWPFEWGPDGTHPRGRDAESERTNLHWAERDLMKKRPWEAAKYAEISKWALETAAEEASKDPSIDQNALRHSIWQARLTYELGPESAERWADAHEAYYPKSEQEDHMADLVNNEYGRKLGEQTQKDVPPKYIVTDPYSGPTQINTEEVKEHILEQGRRYAKSPEAANVYHFKPR